MKADEFDRKFDDNEIDLLDQIDMTTANRPKRLEEAAVHKDDLQTRHLIQARAGRE